MEEKKVNQKEFSTCLEGLSCAEMMKKMTGQKGVGSLCEEMMKKMTGHQGMGSFCEEMKRSMMTKCCGIKEEPKETKRGGSHVSGE
jgi:hypothetical protein